MSFGAVDENARPEFDEVLKQITDYVLNKKIESTLAYDTARLCVMDSIGCALLALRYPECTKLLGPIVPGTVVPNGVRVPGTQYILDPVQGAFNIGTLIRWLDYNDTWLAAEWGHPSDNLGGILAVADYLKNVSMHDVLTALIKAYEIQGILALNHSFNRVGLDHVVLVKVASTAVITHMLGGNEQQILNALSLAWVDGQSLRTYRHAPNTGSRKSWAAGDATSRAVRLALMAMKNEMGYPSVLSAKTWGFCDVLFKGNELKLARPLDSYVMEHILFKISYPAEFHAQTAVECAIQLHPKVKDRLQDIKKITLTTQEAAVRIISKTGPLHNPADRDHCLQYMVAIGFIFGELTADHYEDQIASDPRIDALREKMEVTESKTFSTDYLDQDKRSIANAIQIHFNDGSTTENVLVEYPIGHRRRREEGIPLLNAKFKAHLQTQFPKHKTNDLINLFADKNAFDRLSASEFMQQLIYP